MNKTRKMIAGLMILLLIVIAILYSNTVQAYQRYCYVASTLNSGVERAHPTVWKIWDNTNGRMTSWYTSNQPPNRLLCTIK